MLLMALMFVQINTICINNCSRSDTLGGENFSLIILQHQVVFLWTQIRAGMTRTAILRRMRMFVRDHKVSCQIRQITQSKLSAHSRK